MYVLTRKTFNLLKFLTWLVNGTYLSLIRSRWERNYKWSAHLQDVIFRHKFDLLFQPSGADNFLTTHCGFVSPSYVLQKNVTLYYMTPSEAVFVESDEEVDVTHSDNGSFLRTAQFSNARRIITLPISSFNKLCDEELDDPRGTIIFLGNTARCGSTLMCQIFEATGKCISFSEPDALNAVAISEGKVNEKELDLMGKNCIRMLCKPIPGRDIAGYVIKPTGSSFEAMPLLVKLFPKSKPFFMYREGLITVQSIVRIAEGLPMLKLLFAGMKLHPLLTEYLFASMGLPASFVKMRIPTKLAFGIIIRCQLVNKYREFRKQGINIAAIRYEDIVNHPLESTEAILVHCGLSKELAKAAITALQQDSQRGSPLSRNNLRNVKAPSLVGKEKVVADAYCDQFGLPRLPDDSILEGTITYHED